MKRLLIGLLALVAALVVPQTARAACGALPYTFTNSSSIVDASTTNANNSFLQSCATQVDNTQIGPAGIFASQIVPGSVATAAFGGSYPYTFGLNTAAQVPLTILGYTSQTADLLDIFSTGRATKYVWVDSGGVLRTNQGPVFGAPVVVSGSSIGTTSGTQMIVGADGSGFANYLASGNAHLFRSGTGTTYVTINGSGLTMSVGSLTLSPLTTAGVLTNTSAGVVGTSSAPAISGANITPGTIAQSAVSNGYVDLSSAQTKNGVLTFGSAPSSANGYNAGTSSVYGPTQSSVVNAGAAAPVYAAGLPSGTYGQTAPFYRGSYASNDTFDEYLSSNGDVHIENTGFYGGGLVFETGGANARLTIANSGAATFTGSVTSVGVNAGTGTSQGSSNGSAVAYNPPVYSASGAALASTTHIVAASCTIATSSPYQCTVSFTGAAVFASTPVCEATLPGVSTTNFLGDPTTTAVTVQGNINASGVRANVFCVGS